MKNKWTKVL